MNGELLQGPGDRVFDGVAFDSRKLRGGELFFALAGAVTDGHRFVATAFDQGAAGAVVHRDVEVVDEFPLVRVPDTYGALHDLTRWVRREVPEQLVGITGSAGKTTTKEFLVRLLADRFRVAGSPGNLNNLYGFPLSLLNIPDDTEWMVAEMAMSTPGELAQVSRLGRPDVAVFTNVRLVHLEAFEEAEGTTASLRTIAEAKSGLLAGLPEGGRIVANGRDPEVVWLVERHRQRDPTVRVTWYGVDEQPDPGLAVQASALVPDSRGGGTRFRLVDRLGEGAQEVVVRLPVHGAVNVENFLAAATCARVLGVPLERVRDLAPELGTAPGRGRVVGLSSGVTLVDDSYNANPDATTKALRAARSIEAERHLCVLGDMLELGREERRYHREVGSRAAELGFALVVGVGERAREIVSAAEAEGVETRWFADAGEVASWLEPRLRDGDLLLVKGSRGVGLERLVEALIAEGEGKGA